MAATPFPLPPVPDLGPATPIPADGGNPLSGIQQQLMAKSDAERTEIAKAIYADRGPAPQVPDFETDAANAYQQMQAGGQTQVQQKDDGTGGWKKFIDTLADPTGSSNFLFNAGMNLLQPRPEGQSSFAFGAQGIGSAMDRLTSARAARSKAELEGRKTEADIAKTGQEIRESEANLMTLPSEVALNNARAYQAWMAGNKDAAGPQAAAQVQMIDKLAGTLQRLAPNVFGNRDAATIQAFSLMNPDTTRQDFIGEYVKLNAFLYDDETQAVQAATGIADSLGWSGNQTLGQILMAEQVASGEQPAPTAGPTQEEITASQAGPEEAYAFLKKYYSDQYTDEQMRAFVKEAHGVEPGGTASPTEPAADGEPIMLREEPLSEQELRRQRQREAQADQRERAQAEETAESDTMMEQYKKLRGMSWDEAKAFYDTYKGRLNRRQKLALYRKLKAKKSGQSWIIPQTNPDA